MAFLQQDRKIGFKDIHLCKDQILGIGSYGKVCKAKCDDLLCAAKIIHETLFDPTAENSIESQREHRLPMRRFEQECEFLSTIKHPNIVQFLGILRDPDTQLPVLLMELMDDSLTHFLESATQSLPYHVQVNICHDIIVALSFLHSNDIIHRDLSSNNVLMIGNVKAKVTDFGMARLGDHNHHLTFTQCPGTDVYMPPEAVQDKPVYTEKIDCFSFGVITLQILTREFPQPAKRRQEITVESEEVVEMCISEYERRHNHISMVNVSNPLLSIILSCLKDIDIQRPTAHILCRRMLALKNSSEYSESTVQEKNISGEVRTTHGDPESITQSQYAEQIRDLQLIIQSQAVQLEGKDRSITVKDQAVAAGLQEIQKLKQKQEQLERNTKEMLEMKVKTSTQIITSLEKQIVELQKQLEQQQIDKPEASKICQLRWLEDPRAPCEMKSSFNAVVDNNTSTAYLRAGYHMYAYKIDAHTWLQLPQCVSIKCPSVIINNILTLIGGEFAGSITNRLFSLTEEGSERKWTKYFPSMPTKRYGSSALSTGTSLIVAGGVGIQNTLLATIEVMNIETQQWFTATDLPKPVHTSSLVQVGEDDIYLLGGYDISWHGRKSVYTCSISSLLNSCFTRSIGTRLSRAFSQTTLATVWNKSVSLPILFSACVSVHGKLLAVGGVDAYHKFTATIHMYNPSAKCWEVIGHMSTPRHDCYAAVLSDNQLMVVGGQTEQGVTDIVELASLL